MLFNGHYGANLFGIDDDGDEEGDTAEGDDGHVTALSLLGGYLPALSTSSAPLFDVRQLACISAVVCVTLAFAVVFTLTVAAADTSLRDIQRRVHSAAAVTAPTVCHAVGDAIVVAAIVRVAIVLNIAFATAFVCAVTAHRYASAALATMSAYAAQYVSLVYDVAVLAPFAILRVVSATAALVTLVVTLSTPSSLYADCMRAAQVALVIESAAVTAITAAALILNTDTLTSRNE